MSGDLSSLQQYQTGADTFVEKLKSLSVSQSSSVYTDVIEQLHEQLKFVMANGMINNKAFTFTIVDNLYRVIPTFDAVLLENNKDDKQYIQTRSFLRTLAEAFENLCLFTIFTVVIDKSRLQTVFHHYIGLMKEIYFLELEKFEGLLCCLLPIIGYSSIFARVNQSQIPAELLTYMLTFIKQNWRNPARQRVVKSILGPVKAFCKNPTLVPLVIHHQWPQACIAWLADTNPRPNFSIDSLICLILQKLARHTAGVEILNRLNCLKVIDENKTHLQEGRTEAECQFLEFLQCMIYALITESSEIKQTSILTDPRMCYVLTHVIRMTVEASRNEYFTYQCFHISEILSVLCKLFVNDDILMKCMHESQELFDCLCQLFIHFTTINADRARTHHLLEHETLLSLTNVLWSISFQQIYQDRFRTNSLFMHALTNLDSSSSLHSTSESKNVPRDLCSLKKAAEGILWNLKSAVSQSLHSISKGSEESTPHQPLAMISYSHSDSTFCRELVERLSAHVPVWVDYKQAHDAIAHSDDLWEEIARAMEMATVIILIVSKEYYDSKSCRQELSYASDALKKRIVPVYAPNQQYRASGWLGIRIAGQKYIHFGRKLFPDAIKELASLIVTEQKAPIVSPIPVSVQPVTDSSSETAPEKVIEKSNEEKKLRSLNAWTNKDVRKWFEENQIHADLVTLYAEHFQTGTALIVYARHLKLFYRNEYIRVSTRYYQRFDGKKLEALDFVPFVDALYRLRAEYDPQSIIEDSLEEKLADKMKLFQEGMTWL